MSDGLTLPTLTLIAFGILTEAACEPLYEIQGGLNWIIHV